MSWFDRAERDYEAQTLRMIDSMYERTICECSICENRFYEEDAYQSQYTDKYDFCSEDCTNEWEEENKHDYIDEEVI